MTYGKLHIPQYSVSSLLSQLRTIYNTYLQVKIYFHGDLGMEKVKNQKAPEKSQYFYEGKYCKHI